MGFGLFGTPGIILKKKTEVKSASVFSCGIRNKSPNHLELIDFSPNFAV